MANGEEKKVIPSMSERTGQWFGNIYDKASEAAQGLGQILTPHQPGLPGLHQRRPVVAPAANPMASPLANPQSSPTGTGAPSPLAAPTPTQQQQPERPSFDPNAIVRRGGTFEVKGPLSQRWQTMTPEYREGMNKYIEGLKGQNEIRKAQGEAMVQQYEQAKEMELQKQEINQRFAAQQYQRQQEYQQTREQFAEKRERILGEVNAMEPQDFWASKSTEQRILAGIGLALSSYSQAYTGANPAMDIIDRAIANDLELQRMNINKKRADLADTQGIMAQMRLEYDDDVTANDMARLASLQVVENRVQAMYLKAQNEQAKIGLGALDEELKTQIGEIQMRAAQNETVQAAQTTAMRYQAPMTAGEIVAKYEGSVDYEEMMKGKGDKGIGKGRGMYVPLYAGFAWGSDAEELRKASSDRLTLKDYVKKLIRYSKSNNPMNKIDPDLARADVIRTQAKLQKKGPGLDDLGVIAGPDEGMLNKTIADPNAVFSYSTERLEQTLQNIEIQEMNDVKARIQPAHNIPPGMLKRALPIFRSATTSRTGSGSGEVKMKTEGVGKPE